MAWKPLSKICRKLVEIFIHPKIHANNRWKQNEECWFWQYFLLPKTASFTPISRYENTFGWMVGKWVNWMSTKKNKLYKPTFFHLLMASTTQNFFQFCRIQIPNKNLTFCWASHYVAQWRCNQTFAIVVRGPECISTVNVLNLTKTEIKKW